MCWCIKLTFKIITNLITRVLNDLIDSVYLICNNPNSEDQYECASVNDNNDNDDRGQRLNALKEWQSFNQIQSESYFKLVNRNESEEILSNRVDGSCLVRPFKEKVSFFIFVCFFLFLFVLFKNH